METEGRALARPAHLVGNWRGEARAAQARKHAWSTLLIRKAAAQSQMTRQLPTSRLSHREARLLLSPAAWISLTR